MLSIAVNEVLETMTRIVAEVELIFFVFILKPHLQYQKTYLFVNFNWKVLKTATSFREIE